jgi:hydrogenase-4 component B
VSLIGAGVLLVLLGGASALALARKAGAADGIFGVSVIGGCAALAVAALRVLSGTPAESWVLEPTLPGGAWVLGLDALSAWFLLLLGIVGGITTLYGGAYLEPERAHRPVAATQATWAVLLASMVVVLSARSALLFLVAWEVMALSAYFLIVFEHDRDDVRRAGFLYLVLTHLGTLALLVMFLSWGRAASSYAFADFPGAGGHLPWAGAGIGLLALFGFGIKAGVVPFHFWLPGAHAAAPSHVSALLSGVMLKMGIYGLFRVLALLGTPPPWWGWTVLGLGLASAVFGVLWALAQQDVKRALAYSSVENIGIILLGLGLAALGTAYRQPAVALLGYAGALLHTLNHALFKSLLFLGAGAVVRDTGTREIDRMGGLARHMPRTAVAFLIGSVAIIGLPPLNGFVSEWTLVRGFLAAGRDAGALRWTSLGAAGLGLVGALALACFVRLGGTMFLGRPRDGAVRGEGRADAALFLPMALLILPCVAIGLAPSVALEFAVRVAGGGAGIGLPPHGHPSMGLRLFGAAVLALGFAAWVLRGLGGRRALAGSAATWGCGYSRPTARMQSTAASFGASILAAFRIVAGPEDAGRPGRSPDRVFGSLARPLWNRIQALAHSVRPLHQGRVTTYLQYMIWTLLLLLGFLLFTATGGRS